MDSLLERVTCAFEGLVLWAVVHVRHWKRCPEVGLTCLHLAVHVVVKLRLHVATPLSQSMNKYLKQIYK